MSTRMPMLDNFFIKTHSSAHPFYSFTIDPFIYKLVFSAHSSPFINLSFNFQFPHQPLIPPSTQPGFTELVEQCHEGDIVDNKVTVVFDCQEWWVVVVTTFAVVHVSVRVAVHVLYMLLFMLLFMLLLMLFHLHACSSIALRPHEYLVLLI